jgi:16S rRNA (cytidine1402-2'-O)-methyltransferase
MKSGKLYIVPIPISENTLTKVLPDFNHTIVKELRFFVVEKIKTARQFLREMDRTFPIDDSRFFEQDKHNDYAFKEEAIQQLKAGNDVGLLSEAGYPGIADPGTQMVALAHKYNIEVVPLIGPSSIFLALAASGMNGQGFTFNGYLAKKDPERSAQIKQLSHQISKTGFAEIFIETPYRNQAIFDDLMRNCSADLYLSIAYDITGLNQKISTKSIRDWKKSPFKFDKTPCVFIIGQV